MSANFDKQLKQDSYNTCRALFDFDAFFDFCFTNKVEVLLQPDMQFHCFINYKQGDGSYAADLNAFNAMVIGMHNYMKKNSE